MAMNFWEAQRRAQWYTTLYLFIFITLTLVASFLSEVAMRAFASDSYPTDFPYVGAAFLFITLGVAGFNYLNYMSTGGSYVAESVGAKRVSANTHDPKEKQLLNIVEEIAIATSLPVPPVYVMESQEINAFAAGTKPENAAITVTRGSLNRLNRDELQGVLAHEFGHIYHHDMVIGMRLAAMIMGFFIVYYLGIRLLQSTNYGFSRGRDDDRGNGNGDRKGGVNPVILAGIILLVAGTVTWFFGSILQAMVSRQREYLADASSVQYTRNPDGIANALKKIAASEVSDMPKSAQPYAHLYFNEHASFFSELFATHPPIEKRIAAIEGHPYSPEEDKL